MMYSTSVTFTSKFERLKLQAFHFGIAAITCAALCRVGSVHADPAVASAVALAPVTHSVLVEVRTLEARDAIPENIRSNGVVLSLDKQLEDLRSKLQKLHFKTFKLIGSKTQSVPLMQKGFISLAEGHNLTVRPLYISPSRIGMWIKWVDRSGMDVLDTRMHFDPGESMLTGTDIASDQGMVLAIDVKAAN